MGDEPVRVRRVSLPQTAALRVDPHLYESLRRIVDVSNYNAAVLEQSLPPLPPGYVPGSVYLPLSLLFFDNERNIINVVPPPYPGTGTGGGGSGGGGGGGTGPGGGDGNGPGTGGPRPILTAYTARHADAAADIGGRLAARVIAVGGTVVVGINGAPRGAPLPPSSTLVVNMTTREPFFDHFEIQCWLMDPAGTMHLSQVGDTMAAPGIWDPVNKWFIQSGHIEFPNLATGSYYGFKARVATRNVAPALAALSSWAPWANSIAGDVSGPNPTYAPTTELVAGARVLSANPSGGPTDTAGYRFYVQKRPAPAGIVVSTAPNTASPTTVTTATAHGLTTNDYAQIAGATGNTAINGRRQVTVVSSTVFTIAVAGSGAYTLNSAVVEPAPSEDTPPSTPLVTDAKVSLPLVGLDVVDVWVRAVDTSGNHQTWTYLGDYTLPNPKVTGLSVTQRIVTVEAGRGKVPTDLLAIDFTTPNDPVFAGVAIYAFNARNFATMEKIADFPNLPINTALGVQVMTALDQSGLPAHTVTIYVVALLVTGIEVDPITSQPNVVLSTGLDGSYAGLAAPAGLIAENAGNNVYLEWDDSFDTAILEYWIARAPDGTHNAPGAGIVISSVSYGTPTGGIPTGFTTASAHGLTAGDIVMISGANAGSKINGSWQVAAIFSATQFTAVIFTITPSATPTYTASSGTLWGGVRRIVVPKAINDNSNFGTQNYLDKNFIVADYDPANPKRFRYWIAARTAIGETSAFTAATPLELIPDPSGINQPDPLASVLNRLFNSNGISTTGAANQPLTLASGFPFTTLGPDTTGQPTAPSGWTPWYDFGSWLPCVWVSDGVAGTGEIGFLPTNNTHLVSGVIQTVEWVQSQYFAPRATINFSVYLHSIDVTKQAYNIGLSVNRYHGGSVIEQFQTLFNGSILTTEYQRFNFSLQFSSTGWTDAAADFVQFTVAVIPTSASDTPPIAMVKPMSNDGLTPANWTATMDLEPTPGASRWGISIRPITTPTPPALVHRDASASTWGT